MEHALVIVIHHVAADGWSLGVLGAELAQLYESFSKGLLPSRPCRSCRFNMPTTPAGIAVTSRPARYSLKSHTGSSNCAARFPVMDLPTVRPRPAMMTLRGARSRLSLPGPVRASFRRFMLAENVTLFVTLLTVFKVLLFRYTRQPDVIVGSASAGRERPELENLIGLFINNLVLRTDLSGDPTVRELLTRVRETALSAFSHEHVPLDYLAENVLPNRDMNHSPLFQVMFVLQSHPMQAARSLRGLEGLAARIRHGHLPFRSLGGRH